MGKLQVGDVVTRKSYNHDVFFKVVKIFKTSNNTEMASIKGLDLRLVADAPVSDLVKVSSEQIRTQRYQFIRKHSAHLGQIFGRRKINDHKIKLTDNDPVEHKPEDKELEEGKQGNFFELPGRVLHIDGDPEYLKLCLAAYRKLNINAWGYSVPEEKQPQLVETLLKRHLPDILVLTGHDGLLKGKSDWADLNSYRNSQFFIEAVEKARQFEMGPDVLIIFAGACQSYYEALIQAGANFASSPQRVLIHAFDPVLVVEKVAYTGFADTVSPPGVIRNTITGISGIGGMETKGKLRRGVPKLEVQK